MSWPLVLPLASNKFSYTSHILLKFFNILPEDFKILTLGFHISPSASNILSWTSHYILQFVFSIISWPFNILWIKILFKTDSSRISSFWVLRGAPPLYPPMLTCVRLFALTRVHKVHYYSTDGLPPKTAPTKIKSLIGQY